MVTTTTATRAAANFPVYKPSGAGAAGRAYGYVEITSNPAAGDIIQFCRIPKGAVITGGYVRGNSIEASTEAFDMDIGWAANGVESVDADGLGNFGVHAAAAVAGVKPETGVYMTFGGVLFNSSSGGPQAFSAETIIQGTVVASAANFTNGAYSVVVDYVVP